MIALVLAAVVMAAVFIRWAIANDEMDAHLFHGPDSKCLECEDK